MKKVIGAIAGLVFGLFGIGIFGLVISLTYAALQRIFPTSTENQLWGLVLFDLATLAWALGFVFKSRSLGQYAAAGAGFITGLVGTLAMIAAEVLLSGNQLTGGTADTQQIGQYMVYGFIACSAIHLILIYMHHATAPDLAQQISTGVSRGLIVDRALKQAEKQLEIETAQLAEAITADIVQSVRRDLSLIPANNTVFDRTSYEQTAPTHQLIDHSADTLPVIVPHPTQLAGTDTKEGVGFWQNIHNRLEDVKQDLLGLMRSETPAPKPQAEPQKPVYKPHRLDQYNYIRPPYGNRNHPDLLEGKIPVEDWEIIIREWFIQEGGKPDDYFNHLQAAMGKLPPNAFKHPAPSYHPVDLQPQAEEEPGDKPSPFHKSAAE